MNRELALEILDTDLGGLDMGVMEKLKKKETTLRVMEIDWGPDHL